MRFERELLVPATLCAATFAVALALTIRVGLSGTDILVEYWRVSATATFITFLLWCGLPFFRPAEYRALLPSTAGVAFLRERWPLLLLPLLLGPVFNTGYTLAKTAFPFLVGYRWDGTFAAVDSFVFGGDPWRITHALIGPEGSLCLADAYTFVWGAAFVFVPRFLIFFASPRLAIRFYTARMLTWFFGGVVSAALFSSTGPIFAGIADPRIGHHFSLLRKSLDALLPRGDVILESQGFLRAMNGVPQAIEGAGISAMPSMHLATAALYVLLAWKTRWRIPAVLFWVTIWIGSVHFGYHYAIDGIVGSLIAWASWSLTAPRDAAARGALPPVAAERCAA